MTVLGNSENCLEYFLHVPISVTYMICNSRNITYSSVLLSISVTFSYAFFSRLLPVFLSLTHTHTSSFSVCGRFSILAPSLLLFLCRFFPSVVTRRPWNETQQQPLEVEILPLSLSISQDVRFFFYFPSLTHFTRYTLSRDFFSFFRHLLFRLRTVHTCPYYYSF